jgi:hypothetical protein
LGNLSELKDKKCGYFSDFGLSPLGLRGWGGVPSILRRTSSGSGSFSPCRLVGFFSSSAILKPSVQKELIRWVSEFLWYWEDAGMMGDDAAKVIVKIISHKVLNQNCLNLLPKPQSFFQP